MKTLLRLIALTFSVSSIRTQSDTTVSSITATPSDSSLPGSTTPPTFTLTVVTANATSTTAPDVPPGFTTIDATSSEVRSSVTKTTTSNNSTEPGQFPNTVQVNTTPGSNASTLDSTVSSDPTVTMIPNQSTHNTTASCSQVVPGWAIALLVLAAAVLLLLLLLLLTLLVWCCCRRRKKAFVLFEQQNQTNDIPLYNIHSRFDETNAAKHDRLEKAIRTGTYTITQQ